MGADGMSRVPVQIHGLDATKKKIHRRDGLVVAIISDCSEPGRCVFWDDSRV
jgi:hypothetical protein